MIRTITAGICLTLGVSAAAKPEFLPPAQTFGAKDCGFCHTTPTGGEALNERGEWLVNFKDRRGAEAVSVSWLRIRERRNRSAATPVRTDLTRYQSVEETEKLSAIPIRRVDYTTNHGEWPAYSGNLGAQKYSPLPHVNRSNVDNLELAWVWTSNLDPGARVVDGERKGPDMFKGTPLMVNNKLFVRTRFSAIVAIDPISGSTIWEFEPDTIKGPPPPMFGFSTRGLSFHHHRTSNRVIYTSSDGLLIALDAESGQLAEGFGNQGVVDLKTGLRRNLTRRQASWSNVPSVCNNVIIVGSQTSDVSHWQNLRGREASRGWKENLPVGDVRGFDAISGKHLWTFHTVPQKDEFGNHTWEEESWKWVGNVNVWSQTSCDTELRHVYLPLTAPTHHLYGGDRKGTNLFSTSTVALNVRSGRRIWHFQIVHHDIWDYDLPTPPVVMDFRIDGRLVKAVGQLTKMGYLFVFDRRSGRPVWDIVERKVPQSDLEGERAATTQPHPTKPPPFVTQGFTKNDVIDLTPELREQALAQIADYRLGPLYTPASERGSVINPGVGGGANWGGGAYDSHTGHFFVGARQEPMVLQASAIHDETGMYPRYRVSFRGMRVNNLPVIKPPWSTITAYDMNNGTILWQVPNGPGPKNHQALRELELPDLGNVGAAPGLLLTPELIFFTSIEGYTSSLNAIDRRTGERIWQARIPGFASDAPPITYTIGDDQYVVVGTGGAWEPARMIAFRLKGKNLR